VSGAPGELLPLEDLRAEFLVEEYTPAQGSQTKEDAKPRDPEKFSFPSLGELLECPAEALGKEKPVPDVSSLLFLALLRFLHRLLPVCGGAVDIGKTAASFAEFASEELKGQKEVPTKEQMLKFYRLAASPYATLLNVTSVVGGLMAQEAIKSITHRDEPLRNFVVFSSEVSTGFVELVPPPGWSAAKKAGDKAGTGKGVKRPVEEVLDLDSD